MCNKLLIIIISTTLLIQVYNVEVESARILGVFPLPMPSHYILGHRLMKELALRGHEVTMISSFGQKNPIKNYKDIVLDGFYEEMEDIKKDFANLSPLFMLLSFIKMTDWLTERSLNSSNVQELLNSNEKFDLIIMVSVSNEAHAGLAHHFDAPLIVLSTVGASPLVNHYTKTPAPPSYCSQMAFYINGKLNFWDRLKNTVIGSIMDLLYEFYHFPQQNAILHKLFPSAPYVKDIIKQRTSLVLLNSHPSISPAKPLVPNMIEVGGYHIEEPKALPKNLKEFMDNAKEGVILFSLGSNFKSTMLSDEKRHIFMSVFEKLPYQILWKFEDDKLPGKPKNVRIEKWLPQNDLLAHPNLKLFITHGGLLSTTEVIYHGVPIVGVPVFGDQKMNMDVAQGLGIGKFIELNDITHDTFLNIILEILNDKKYRENAQQRSKLLHDQPIKPFDSAMYWIEFVLRHKYANHLKTSATYYDDWELTNIDVWVTLAILSIISMYIPFWMIKKLCCSRRKNIQTQEKKKSQ